MCKKDRRVRVLLDGFGEKWNLEIGEKRGRERRT